MILKYDVVVIGGGHAGCEAACASANMGAKTLLVTMDMNKIAQMSCNPAVGGIAKGQIVREIDALGGQMGIVTDRACIQFRMLNIGKGPAMWSPRAQCDRGKFIWLWREVLDKTDNLDIWQDQACELLTEEAPHPTDGTPSVRVKGVHTIWGAEIHARSVVVTAGTFLNGLLHIGRKMIPGGRIAEPAVADFTESITRHGIRSARMKTGTPVRIDRRSVDFSLLTEQPGETRPYMFSYLPSPSVYYLPHPSTPPPSSVSASSVSASSVSPSSVSASSVSALAAVPYAALNARPASFPLPQLSCWTVNTNPQVHEVLRSGLKDSPLYNGQIQSIGPRYCPSIETKLVTFPDRDTHPLFLEPEGTDTNEMYLNGFSSSLPMDVQIEAIKQMPAFRNVKVYRPGYAIEYDFFYPTQLKHSLESKKIEGLFLAGQVNGTTGYEEAAGQGLVAGVNAALNCGGTETFVKHRDESYIGVLIDDLVTKGVDEPYRMFTSRAEYRILLRQDDADARLTERAYHLGLAKRDRYDWWMQKKEHIERIEKFCSSFPIKAKEINPALEQLGTTPLQFGVKLEDLVVRPQLNFANLMPIIPELREVIDLSPNRKEEIAEAAEIRIKYKGYIERERQVAEKMHRLENIRIKGHFDYENIQSLSTECRQKLKAIDPETLAQASRIPGVSPSDINVLLVLMGR